MTIQEKSRLEALVEKLDRELLARGAVKVRENQFSFEDKEGTPQRNSIMTGVREYYGTAAPLSLDAAFSHINTPALARLLMVKTRELNTQRGISGEDSRRDYFEITDDNIKENADRVAAICMKKDLNLTGDGAYFLRTKNYGKAFNLCQSEPFYHQDIAAGRMSTGFLVGSDTIATAGHCIEEEFLNDYRFIFSYKLIDSSSQETPIPAGEIYKGVEIIERICRHKGDCSDWALVKLDRRVSGKDGVTLSGNGITAGQPVYIIGYPVGLPLKYSPGASVRDISDAYFSADLNVYNGSSGSPVFDCETHKVVGIVVRGDSKDFRLVENCWRSVIYPRTCRKNPHPECTRVLEFINECRRIWKNAETN